MLCIFYKLYTSTVAVCLSSYYTHTCQYWSMYIGVQAVLAVVYKSSLTLMSFMHKWMIRFMEYVHWRSVSKNKNISSVHDYKVFCTLCRYYYFICTVNKNITISTNLWLYNGKIWCAQFTLNLQFNGLFHSTKTSLQHEWSYLHY